MDDEMTPKQKPLGVGDAGEEAPLSVEDQLDQLARLNRQARKGLCQQVARERAFAHLHEEIGLSADDIPEAFEQATEEYTNGKFFLKNLALFYDVAPELSMVVFHLRQEWIREYQIKTVPELLLLDQAMMAYFHSVRVHKEIANMLSLTEMELFYPEDPIIKLKARRQLGKEFDDFAAKDAIRKLQERLVPVMERFQHMFLRSLRTCVNCTTSR